MKFCLLFVFFNFPHWQQYTKIYHRKRRTEGTVDPITLAISRLSISHTSALGDSIRGSIYVSNRRSSPGRSTSVLALFFGSDLSWSHCFNFGFDHESILVRNAFEVSSTHLTVPRTFRSQEAFLHTSFLVQSDRFMVQFSKEMKRNVLAVFVVSVFAFQIALIRQNTEHL